MGIQTATYYQTYGINGKKSIDTLAYIQKKRTYHLLTGSVLNFNTNDVDP